jgi:HEAT repeat protein
MPYRFAWHLHFGSDYMKPMLGIMLIILIAGCSREAAPQISSHVVEAWADLGMYLPSENDVTFIRNGLPESLAALQSGLAHKDKHVRMSSAYVAEKLGPEAAPLVPAMITILQVETLPTVRVYIACALAEIGHVDSDSIHKL